MKKISNDAANAFLEAEPFLRYNTQVIIKDGEVQMLLHGSVIARRDMHVFGTTKVSLCGYSSVVTRERVNRLLQKMEANIAFVQRNYAPCIKYVDTQKIIEIDACATFTVTGEIVNY